ncbi:hypothetical protein GOBAR_AA07597 [Gossypium barbadense]|uniref:LIM zinc-binding domain-containing protein n=1 Tax=Gossypium barbadense TaxID=3634 RepID=A0A2P5YBR8_GOSBA|nr:hypothetical protein GOBAR_AA07597 [Gossypium barbadense]
MGWLTKILKGSSNKGRYHERYGDGRTWDEPRRSTEGSDGFDKDEIDCAIAISLSEVDQKGKKVIALMFPIDLVEDESEPEEESDEDVTFDEGHIEDDDEKYVESHVEEEEDSYAKAHEEKEDDRHAKVQQEEDEDLAKVQLEEDEQLAKAIQESLNVESPPRSGHGGLFSPYPFFFSASYRICAGCNAEIGHGRYLSCMGSVWHPECFCCHACNQPINDYEFSVSGNRPFHKSCYKEQHHPKCDVCRKFMKGVLIPTNPAGLIEYRAHPYWMQKYCPSHERDGTPRCCSCERMEPVDVKYISLDDGRRLCLECLDSAIMDTHECQPLYLEIQEFYEGLNMKVEQQVPLLLVERQALNEAMEGEKNGHHHLPETRGLCLSEEQTVTTVLRRPRIGAGYRFIDMITEPHRLIRRCEVTAILILYGLPRLLTGSILAHEMMHAWLRLKGGCLFYQLMINAFIFFMGPILRLTACNTLDPSWSSSRLMQSERANRTIVSCVCSLKFSWNTSSEAMSIALVKGFSPRVLPCSSCRMQRTLHLFQQTLHLQAQRERIALPPSSTWPNSSVPIPEAASFVTTHTDDS